MEGRRRLSRGSGDRQTSHKHPMVGTPELVPDPSTVILMFGVSMRLSTAGSGAGFRRGGRLGGLGFFLRPLLGDLHESETQFGQCIFDEPLLLNGQIALRF